MDCLKVDSLWMIAKPVDMRKGVEGLSAHIAQHTNTVITPSHGYIFTNTLGNRMCLLVYDANGVSVMKRKLHRGHFKWQSSTAIKQLLDDEWVALVMGLDFRKLHAIFNIQILK